MTTVAVVPWAPSSFEEGVGLAVMSLACWGTWSNTAKDTSRLLNDFYHDFSVGLLCLSILAYCTLGRAVFSAESGQLGVAKVCAAFSAGGLFNLANILLIESMMLVGISVAIPIGIGIALVLGTLLTYFADGGSDHTHHPFMLFTGVVFALLAILAQVQATAKKEAYEKLPDTACLNDSTAVDRSSARGAGDRSGRLMLCVVAGVTMSLWSPLSAFSMKGVGRLTPYSSFLIFVVGVCCTTGAICFYVRPLLGANAAEPKFILSEYVRAPFACHVMGFLGGLLWAVGTVSSLVSGQSIGMALSYSIGQSAPMVASLWGLFYYKEFAGAPRISWMFISVMFVCYVLAIGLVAGSK